MEIDKVADAASWIWKGIMNSLIFLKSNIVIKINDGFSTGIWTFVWLPCTTSPPVSINPDYLRYTFVSELIEMLLRLEQLG